MKIDFPEKSGKGRMLDEAYKEIARKKIIEPTFLIDHPIEFPEGEYLKGLICRVL